MRELRNAIEHAAIVARGQPIRLDHFPAVPAAGKPPAEQSQNQIDADLIAWARHHFASVPRGIRRCMNVFSRLLSRRS